MRWQDRKAPNDADTKLERRILQLKAVEIAQNIVRKKNDFTVPPLPLPPLPLSRLGGGG